MGPYIAQMCMLGATLHYLFLEPDMSKALLCLIAGALFAVVGRLDRVVEATNTRLHFLENDAITTSEDLLEVVEHLNEKG